MRSTNRNTSALMNTASEAGREARGGSQVLAELVHSALRRPPPTPDDTQEATTAMNPVSHRAGPIKTAKTGLALSITTESSGVPNSA